MAKDRYTEERDKQEEAKNRNVEREAQRNANIVDQDIVVESDPVEETTEADSSDGINLTFINFPTSG